MDFAISIHVPGGFAFFRCRPHHFCLAEIGDESFLILYDSCIKVGSDQGMVSNIYDFSKTNIQFIYTAGSLADFIHFKSELFLLLQNSISCLFLSFFSLGKASGGAICTKEFI